jgi:glycosyltransferase involved in cell wall biosynthesis
MPSKFIPAPLSPLRKELIFIDCLHLNGNSNGGQDTYLKSILNFDSFYNSSSTYLLLQNSTRPLPPSPNAHVITLPLSNTIIRILVQQFILPLVLLCLSPFFSLRFWAPAYTAPIFLPPSVTLVLTIHDLYYHIAPQSIGFVKTLYWRILVPPSIRRANIIICISRTTMSDLASLFPCHSYKFRLVYEAGDHVHNFKQVPTNHIVPLDTPIYVSLGSTRPIKDPYTLVYGFMEYVTRISDKKPLLLITGSVSSKYAKSLMYSATTPRIIFTGHLSHDELYSLLSRATLLILSSFYEGFGLPSLEAQQLCVPVVASDIPVMREILGDSAVFFPPGDPGTLANVLFSLNAKAISNLRHSSLNNSSRYSWERAALQTSSLLLNG